MKSKSKKELIEWFSLQNKGKMLQQREIVSWMVDLGFEDREAERLFY